MFLVGIRIKASVPLCALARTGIARICLFSLTSFIYKIVG